MYNSLKKFLLLTLCFVAFVPLGTLSHEYGHILVAKSLGFETTLHFASAESHSKEKDEAMALYHANETAIQNGEAFPNQERYHQLDQKLNARYFWVTWGGPIQTMLTGSLGLLILFFRGRKERPGLLDWLAIFMSLFWLRECFNLCSRFLQGVLSNGDYFGGDEAVLAEHLEIWPGSFALPLGLIGFFVAGWICFHAVPKKDRSIFILSGLLGGTSGFFIWMLWLGPLLIP